ncbi:hypothetical protein CBA19CS91_26415 [Paraburkholderia hospita]|nr:hypothetical protein CBA19CS91_26415 [Paraburkholderia hospita]
MEYLAKPGAGTVLTLPTSIAFAAALYWLFRAMF